MIGREEVIEEAFVDVFCDLLYGGGWMDKERMEEVDRECNWALVGIFVPWWNSRDFNSYYRLNTSHCRPLDLLRLAAPIHERRPR